MQLILSLKNNLAMALTAIFKLVMFNQKEGLIFAYKKFLQTDIKQRANLPINKLQLQ